MKLTATPDNTAVVTAFSYAVVPPTCRFLVESAGKVGIQIIRFGKDEPFTSLAQLKVVRLIQWLSHLEARFEYVLFIDSRDSLFIRPLSAICDTYNGIGSLILMAGEPDVWPMHEEQWAKRHPQFPSGLNCLNSGGFIGHRATLINALCVLADIYGRVKTGGFSDIPEHFGDNDQMLWQIAYVNGMIPLRVDHEQRIFVTATNTPPDDYDWVASGEVAPLVMKNGSRPSVIHFAGNAWCAMPFFVRAML